MKTSLSIRAMLIGLFAAAIVGACVLAATGWVTNQRLVNAQRYITEDVLALKEAGRQLALTLGDFGQRHADLLAAQNEQALEAVRSREALDERFQRDRDTLARAQDPRMATLDADYQRLLDGDAALLEVRRDTLELHARITAQIEEMERRIESVIQGGQSVFDRTLYTQTQREASQRDLMEAWREEGTTTLPTQLLDDLYRPRVDIGRLSGEARLAIARLADLSRQMLLVDDIEALMELRNLPQVDLALQHG